MTIEIAIGSIWREVDGRSERYVKVMGFDPEKQKARIANCNLQGRNSDRTTWAKYSRFGKAYKLVPKKSP